MNKPDGLNNKSPNLDDLARIDKICTQFEESCQAGNPMRIEKLLTGLQDQARQQALLELLLLDLDYHAPDDLELAEAEYRRRFKSDWPVVAAAMKKHRAYQSDAPPQEQKPGEPPPPELVTQELADEQVSTGEMFAPASVPERVRYLNDYELLEEIARGGMGIVYRAKDRRLNRIVAIKMLLPGELASEDQIDRFLREARTAAKLRHPNIVTVYEVGLLDEVHYFAMDYIDGQDLEKFSREHALSPTRVARYVMKAAKAVHYAHSERVLHRDLKPSNLLIDQDSQVYVTDFGLAKSIALGETITKTGIVMGTPSYMPPEQAKGAKDKIGVQSDVYGLGAVLFFLLTGRAPFEGDNPFEVISAVLNDPPPSLRSLNANVPKELEMICLKCLEKEPEKRYPSAGSLSIDLERWLGNEPILASEVGLPGRAKLWLYRHWKSSLYTTVCLFLTTLIFLAGRTSVENRGPTLGKPESEHEQMVQELKEQKRQLEIELEAERAKSVVLTLENSRLQEAKTETEVINRRLLRTVNGFDSFGQNDAAYLYQRGLIHFQHHQWQEASRDFQKAMRLEDAEPGYQAAAAISVLLSGKQTAYHQLCERWDQRIQKPEYANEAWAAGRTWALVPHNPCQLQNFLKLVREATLHENQEWHQLIALVALLYRDGQFQKAEQLLQETVEPAARVWDEQASTLLWKSLIKLDIGDIKSARGALVEAEALMNDNPSDLGSDLKSLVVTAEFTLLPGEIKHRIKMSKLSADLTPLRAEKPISFLTTEKERLQGLWRPYGVPRSSRHGVFIFWGDHLLWSAEGFIRRMSYDINTPKTKTNAVTTTTSGSVQCRMQRRFEYLLPATGRVPEPKHQIGEEDEFYAFDTGLKSFNYLRNGEFMTWNQFEKNNHYFGDELKLQQVWQVSTGRETKANPAQASQISGYQELMELQGLWQVVMMQSRNEPLTEVSLMTQYPMLPLVFIHGNALAVISHDTLLNRKEFKLWGASGDKDIGFYQIQIVDDRAQPIYIDLVDQNLESDALGACKIDGDLLTLCLAPQGSKRPTTFETFPQDSEKTGPVVLKLQRVHPDQPFPDGLSELTPDDKQRLQQYLDASRNATPTLGGIDKYSTAIILEAPHSRYADEVRERYKHLPWPHSRDTKEQHVNPGDHPSGDEESAVDENVSDRESTSLSTTDIIEEKSPKPSSDETEKPSVEPREQKLRQKIAGQWIQGKERTVVFWGDHLIVGAKDRISNAPSGYIVSRFSIDITSQRNGTVVMEGVPIRRYEWYLPLEEDAEGTALEIAKQDARLLEFDLQRDTLQITKAYLEESNSFLPQGESFTRIKPKRRITRAASKSVANLQGLWQAVVLQSQSKPLLDDEVATEKYWWGSLLPLFLIEGDTLTLLGGNRMLETRLGINYDDKVHTIEIKGQSQSNRFDLLSQQEPKSGFSGSGIYKLDEDLLTLCLTSLQGVHPILFATNPHDPPDVGPVLIKLERVIMDQPYPDGLRKLAPDDEQRLQNYLAASQKVTPEQETVDKYSTAIILEAPHSKYADHVRERYKHLTWPKDTNMNGPSELPKP